MAIPPDRFADTFTDGWAFLSSEALDGARSALDRDATDFQDLISTTRCARSAARCVAAR
jgi:hypothetical protein